MIWRITPLLLLAFVAPAFGQEAKPDGFPIGYWCGPPPEFTTIDRYQQVKDAGFSFAMPPNGGADSKLNHKILDFCQAVGLKAIVADARMPLGIGGNEDARTRLSALVNDYKNHPALYGYYICDEPGRESFLALGEVVAALKQADPAHIAFINMLPNHAPASIFGQGGYPGFIRAFAEQTKPPVISYDHYHFLNDSDRPGFIENLRDVRAVSLEKQIPFWQIVLCTQHGPYRNLTEGELRYQAMHTLAWGGKGLLWFTYWSPANSDKTFEWKHAMINEDGTPDPHYDVIRKINFDVAAIGGELLEATSTEVIPGQTGVRQTVGLFKGPKGERLALIASDDYKEAHEAKVTVINSAKVEQYDPKRKEWLPIKTRSEEGKFVVNPMIAPGDAVLVRW